MVRNDVSDFHKCRHAEFGHVPLMAEFFKDSFGVGHILRYVNEKPTFLILIMHDY